MQGLRECASWIPTMRALWVANCLSSSAALPGNGVTPASVAGVSLSFNELQLKEMKACRTQRGQSKNTERKKCCKNVA